GRVPEVAAPDDAEDPRAARARRRGTPQPQRQDPEAQAPRAIRRLTRRHRVVRWRRDQTTAVAAVIRGIAWLLRGHAGWMGFNLALAAVPLVLAVVLFRGRGRRGPIWWAGVGVFAVFLPNAPYVMTDVVHFIYEVMTAPTQ